MHRLFRGSPMPPLLVNHSMRPIVIDNQTPPRRGITRARLPSRAPVPALSRALWLPEECQISRASPRARRKPQTHRSTVHSAGKRSTRGRVRASRATSTRRIRDPGRISCRRSTHHYSSTFCLDWSSCSLCRLASGAGWRKKRWSRLVSCWAPPLPSASAAPGEPSSAPASRWSRAPRHSPPLRRCS